MIRSLVYLKMVPALVQQLQSPDHICQAQSALFRTDAGHCRTGVFAGKIKFGVRGFKQQVHLRSAARIRAVLNGIFNKTDE